MLRDKAKLLIDKGFFHVFTSTVINKIIGFASAIVLVRIISKNGYGAYSYANNILSFCLLFSGLGVTNGILQLCSEKTDHDDRMKIYNYGCKVGIRFNLILAIVVLSIALLIPLPIEGSNNCLKLMCLIPFASLLPDLQRIFLRTELRNKEYSIANTFSSIMIFVLSCVLSLCFQTKGLIAATYFASIITVFFIFLKDKVPISINCGTLSTNTSYDFWKICIISMINSGLSRLMYLLDVFVLGIVVPENATIASYKVATNIPTALLFVPSAVVTFIYPYFARHRNEKEWLIKRYKQILLYLGAFCLIVSLFLIIFAKPIISFVFGKQYIDAVLSFQILSASFAISSTFRIISGNLLVTQRKLKFNLFLAVVSSLINTILNVFLIRKWGASGAAVATIATVIVTSMASTAYLVHTFKNIGEH